MIKSHAKCPTESRICPPLLAEGEHPFDFEQLKAITVYDFPLSTTRREIFSGFERLVRELRGAKILGDLVVDGSFLTEEINPDDIDFALCVTPEFYDACSPEQRKILEWIRDDFSISVTHRCDCYLCVEYSQDHPAYFEDIQNRAYWINLYAMSVVYRRIRGVAILRLET